MLAHLYLLLFGRQIATVSEPAPPHRTLYIAAERRAYAVPAESRVLFIAAEDRTYNVESA